MSWHRGPLVGFDTETTGVNTETDRIVSFCIGLIDGTGQRPAETLAHPIINPGIPIPQGASSVHGITTERAQAEGVPAREGVEFVASSLASALLDEPSAPLIVFNATFDLTLLDRECRRHDLPNLADRLDGRPLHVIDPYVLDKALVPRRRGKRTLSILCGHYQVPINGAHQADQDTLAAARIAWRMAEQHPHIAAMTLPDLHDMQVNAKAEQATSFAEYLRSQGKQADDVRTEWPLIPFEAMAGAE